MDSIYVHANFGSSLGGISYPMLADFHPKGAMAQSMGVYKGEVGITDRATVIIDAKGVVRHSSSIGQRDMAVLAKTCQEIDSAYGETLSEKVAAPGISGATMYVRSNCGASRSVLLAATNLHIADLSVKNVSEDESARSELKALTDAETAPVLVVDGKVVAESATIVSHLASVCAPL